MGEQIFLSLDIESAARVPAQRVSHSAIRSLQSRDNANQRRSAAALHCVDEEVQEPGTDAAHTEGDHSIDVLQELAVHYPVKAQFQVAIPPGGRFSETLGVPVRGILTARLP